MRSISSVVGFGGMTAICLSKNRLDGFEYYGGVWLKVDNGTVVEPREVMTASPVPSKSNLATSILPAAKRVFKSPPPFRVPEPTELLLRSALPQSNCSTVWRRMGPLWPDFGIVPL